MIPRRYRVTDVRPEMKATVTLTLTPVEDPIDPWLPGQFAMLWAFGVGEVPISMSARPPGGDGLVNTVRSVGAVSEALCRLVPGDMVGVRGPFGAGWDLDAARGGDVVVVAGGIGLAPVRPLIHDVLADRDAFGRVDVLVGARSPTELLYPDELAAWSDDPTVGMHLIVDRAASGWSGEVGVVTELVPRLRARPEAAVAFVCGPEVMMRFVANALVSAGMAPGRVRVSLERNMKCAVALCGHCQLGPVLVCRDGPVFTYEVAAPLMRAREL